MGILKKVMVGSLVVGLGAAAVARNKKASAKVKKVVSKMTVKAKKTAKRVLANHRSNGR